MATPEFLALNSRSGDRVMPVSSGKIKKRYRQVSGVKRQLPHEQISIIKKTPTCTKDTDFLRQIIQYAVWLYCRFSLSQRDIEDLLAERGIIVNNRALTSVMNPFDSGATNLDRRIHQNSNSAIKDSEIRSILMKFS